MKGKNMKKWILFLLILGVVFAFGFSQDRNDLKVFISVDMEGVAGVVHWEDVSRNGKDYDLFREIMTQETNAAIEGAIAAGATEILVRDSHGSARNILPHLLDKRARLLRDWSGGHLSMMEGIDKTYDAVVFIGYHAKAGTENSPLAHTMSSSRIKDLSINGISLPEAGYNALIAGYFDVPVVFLSGGQAICKQVKELFGDVETVVVKEGIGTANLGLHPEVVQDKIRKGVEMALKNLKNYKPYQLKSPFNMTVTVKKKDSMRKGLTYPGVERTGEMELTYTSKNLVDIFKAFGNMY
jgi:D-amino peptidase